MKKIVTTEMTDKSVIITLSSEDSESKMFSSVLEFPFEIVNPRIALDIASILVRDPSVPDFSNRCSNEKED